MAKFFPVYADAFNAALDLANLLGRETGIEKFKEYGKPGFLVHTLPKPENRFGFELRCEVVQPNSPRMGNPQ